MRSLLDDFDLACCQDDGGSTGHERVGTLLFMALDLLTASAIRGNAQQKQIYRHGAESLVWCNFWITT